MTEPTPLDRGPFIVLGLDKDADDRAIEARLTERADAARRGELPYTVEELEQARDVLLDPERRLAADADGLNTDIASGELGRLTRLYCLDGGPPGWEPMDPEPPIVLPGAATIDPRAAAAGLQPPEVPLEFPALTRWLQRLTTMDPDPWGPDVPN